MWEGITSSQLNRHKLRSHKQECEREQNSKQQQQQQQQQQPEQQQQIKSQPLDDGMVAPSAADMYRSVGLPLSLGTTDPPASAS